MHADWAWPLRWNLSEEDFAAAAERLLRRQAAENPVYGRFLRSFPGFDPALATWTEFPALPVEIFRTEKVFCFPENEGDFYFETSGSTSEQKGRHWFHRADYYERSLQLAFEAMMPDLSDHVWLRLIPSQADRPHSSLAHMIEFLAGQRAAGPGTVRVDADFALDIPGLRRDLEKIPAGKKAAIFGTSFAVAQLAEIFLEEKSPLRLPAGSVLFETGGYKGRHRELSREEFLGLLEEAFGLKPAAVWNEYGMTELSSQCYANAAEGLHRAPPWLKVRIIDPVSGGLCVEGQPGLIELVDLANVDSVAALATQDVGHYEGGGFRIHGRLKQAPLRGCSLPYELD